MGSRYIVIIALLSLIGAGFVLHHESEITASGEDAGTSDISEVELTRFNMEALVGPGDDIFLAVDPNTLTVQPESQPPLSRAAENALDLVADWLRLNLTHKFRLLPGDDQTAFANLIINAPDERYRDEIAFCIAHSTPETLRDQYFFPQLLTDNARLIYEHDALLDYVRIVEKDDHTTLAYLQEDGSEVELDRDDYYWFVVHPKLGDELPTYVDPEYDYTSDPPFDRNYGVPPPGGKYWREWFFVHNKTGQPLLSESLEGKNTTLSAIKAINGWISNSMQFTSDQERPVQPVRIYEKGIGRCGEYQDMRSAAARAALIPVVATSNSAEDHVWNEFWDLQWYHWDGTINNPRMYEKGWGKTISSVWNCRGDGYTWSVTSRYSDICVLDITVVDSAGLPVDGATVEIQTENFYNPDIKTTTIRGSTDHLGKLVIEVGDGRNYWGKASSGDLGSDPAGILPPREIVMGSEAGRTYEVRFRLPMEADSPRYIDQGGIEPASGSVKMRLSFEVGNNIVRGSSPVASGRFDLWNTSGNLDLFITDELNFNAYQAGTPFQCFHLQERSQGSELETYLYGGTNWRIILSNEFSQWTSKLVNVTVTLIGENGLTIDGPAEDEGLELGSSYIINGRLYSRDDQPEVEVRIGDTGEWEMRDNIYYTGSSHFTWDFHHIFDDVEPGSMNIWARVNISGVLYQVKTRVNVYDNSSPGISIQGAEHKARQGEPLEISGTVFDDHMVSRMYFTVDGSGDMSEVELGENLRDWSLSTPTIKLDLGDHYLTVFAEDPSGNTAGRRADFEVTDADPPIIRITSPQGGSFHRKGENIDLSGKLYDPSGIEKLLVSIDGSASIDITDTILEDLSFSFSLGTNFSSVGTGYVDVAVSAVDRGDNLGRGTVEVYLDGTYPDVDLKGAPTDLAVNRESLLDLVFQVTDDTGISSIGITFNGEVEMDATRYLDVDLFEMTISPAEDLGEGENMVEAVITDIVGHRTTVAWSIFVDVSPPVIIFTDLPEFSLIGEKLSIRIEVEDDHEIDGLSVVSNGDSWQAQDPGTGSFDISLDTNDARPGIWRLMFSVVDAAGNIAEIEKEINFITAYTDSDRDGIPDLWEYGQGFDPFTFDSDQDPDGDGYTNYEEYLGMDRDPGNDDSTDPKRSSSHPDWKEDDGGIPLFVWILIFLVASFLAASSIYFLFARKRARSS
ncbi:MAG: transglutaminase-like domain-containing protein [Thermoplasmatota archaeon]